jgi:hypothetical protein
MFFFVTNAQEKKSSVVRRKFFQPCLIACLAR